MCLCVSLLIYMWSTAGSHGFQKMALNCLELDLPVVVSHSEWVVAIKSRCSDRAALTNWVTLLAPNSSFLNFSFVSGIFPTLHLCNNKWIGCGVCWHKPGIPELKDILKIGLQVSNQPGVQSKTISKYQHRKLSGKEAIRMYIARKVSGNM